MLRAFLTNLLIHPFAREVDLCGDYPAEWQEQLIAKTNLTKKFVAASEPQEVGQSIFGHFWLCRSECREAFVAHTQTGAIPVSAPRGTRRVCIRTRIDCVSFSSFSYANSTLEAPSSSRGINGHAAAYLSTERSSATACRFLMKLFSPPMNNIRRFSDQSRRAQKTHATKLRGCSCSCLLRGCHVLGGTYGRDLCLSLSAMLSPCWAASADW